MLALTMAMNAIAIDIMLPAFPEIREATGLAPDSPQVGQLVTAFFLGMALSQVPAGVLADRFGRKPVLHGGLVIYTLGGLGTMLAPTLGWMLVARFVWGLGAGGPRVVAIATVRDRYRGDQMARVMSTVMAMFILAPVIAPSIGSLLTSIGPWQLVFGAAAAAAMVLNVWALRLPETLRPEHRRPLRWAPVIDGVRIVLRTRQTAFLGLALAALIGAFMSYLASSELIIEDTLGLDGAFPIVFGGLAIGMGVATFSNRRFVERAGTWGVLRVGLTSFTGLAAIVVLIALVTDGRPPATLFLPVLALLVANHAVLVPNVNAAAMEPVGAVAGTASAVLGATSMAAGAIIGAVVDGAFDGTITPLSWAFLGAGLVALACFTAAHRVHRDVTRAVTVVAAAPPAVD